MEPLVSIIITTKNSSRTLEKCLQSVKNQSYKNIELIVVDNNSRDMTKEIAQKYADKVFNLGPERSTQRNFGAKVSKGKYLLTHDCDIYFHKDSIKECVDLIEKEQCQAVILSQKSIGVGFWAKVRGFEKSFYVGNDLVEAPRFFDRNIYFGIGGHDEMLNSGEDWDLSIRIREKGYKISRTTIFLEHDEGRSSLMSYLDKIKYYSPGLKIYSKKHPLEFKKQFSFFYRFPLHKIIQKGLMNPVLFGGMIFMKSLEYFIVIKFLLSENRK